MKVTTEEVRTKLVGAGLKVTPQRMNILEAVYALKNHPTAERICEFIRERNPNIATGTVYKVLETLVEKNIIKKVKTDRDIMRYDGLTENHHHLYCSECDVIEDYFDSDLDNYLKDYFNHKQLPGFKIEDIVLQIRGKFNKC
ncbi:Fur family transcriptional regulator [Saccharicrinis sp. FJH62]|uniref:Fur family transcriptional regulator n=1 Tax=Saccharicrinis sp. FJH62 TaxID=3344657 RepID=UPI0035D5199E